MRSPSIIAVLSLATLVACSPDRYEPLAETPFFLHTPGMSHSFSVRPHFYSRTEVALLSKSHALPIPSSGPPVPFSWDVTATAYQRGKAVETIKLEPQAWWHHGEGYYHSVSLGAFESLSFIPRQTEIIVRVVKVDPMFVSADPSLSVAVRASPIP